MRKLALPMMGLALLVCGCPDEELPLGGQVDGGGITQPTCLDSNANCDGDPANGCEVNLAVDRYNCGACGNFCSGLGMCVNGACSFDAGPGCTSEVCDGIDNDCNGQVDDGANLCGAHAVCGNGHCLCNAGYDNCNANVTDGCEAAVGIDKNNCGACGNVCASGVCQGGVCVGDAGPGCTAEVCDGLDNDCNGLLDDGANLCGAGLSCVNGACVAGPCATGKGDCDGDPSNGCEVDLLIDKNHCGMCANVCASGVCQAGACVGDGGPGCTAEVCDGLDNNCNGQVDEGMSLCGPNAACGSGTCVCSVGYGDCDANHSNGCEVNLSADKSNCGACGQVCAGVCVNGACQ